MTSQVPQHTPFNDAFEHGARFRAVDDAVITMELHRLGDVRVETGWLCVGDPLTTPLEDADTLARPVPKGRFPVEVAVARFPSEDRRVACARVRFGDAPARRWEAADFRGLDDEEASTAGADALGAPPGYGVDAGTGCFFDAAAGVPLDEATSDAWVAGLESRHVDTWTSLVADHGDANVVMFSSGWGDGIYGSWWGLDGSDRLVEVVTDFGVLVEPRSEHMELRLPLRRGAVRDPWLARHRVTARVPLFSRSTLVLGSEGSAAVELSDGSPVELRYSRGERRYTWDGATPGARAIIRVFTGVTPLARV